MNTATKTRLTIAQQNDQFRQHPGADWMVTSGVDAKGPIFVLAVVNTVRKFQCLHDRQ